MPRGRVIDPEGKQAQLTWGYIQRFDGPDRKGKKNWPWKCLRKKLIPFLNNGDFRRGQIVVFDVSEVEIKDPEFGAGKLGIATNVRKVTRK
ncbi:MAG: hypothetical protein MI975_00955 [Cytophagales bacterium]|nr:hypothetical protein [Cytophagales bacterium]